MTKAKKTENLGEANDFSFKAETRQLLHILIHSLYKDREVFLRELLSNASDALNRIRFTMLTNHDVLDADAELCIRISVDKDARTITIQDSGIGMTREEIIENLGTIAQSGARKFLEAAKDQTVDATQVIGQFGVGFYSVFMVAEWVRVTSRSYLPDAQAVTWYSVGEENFQVEPAEMAQRGAKVEIKLKEDLAEFADEYRLKSIIHKYSDYIGFPIYVGEAKEQVNKQTAIWRASKQDVTEEQYNDFYRQLTLDFEEPLMRIHLIADAPVQVYALLYIPSKSRRDVFALRKEDGQKLYSRNILIDEYSKDLLPEYLRFVQGVVDSEDLPLNVSRETIQATGLMTRLKKVLTNQVLKELENLAKNDAEKYQTFWQEFGEYLKQGIAGPGEDTEKLQTLLRFKTTLNPETWSSLDGYVERLKADQKAIYYIVGDDIKSAMRSPHLDYFQAQGLEVLLLTEAVDAFMLLNLHKYKDFELKNVALAEETPAEKPEEKTGEEKAAQETFDHLIERFKQVLGERVADVRSSNRLSQSVARLVDKGGGLGAEYQRVYKLIGRDFAETPKILELNPAHPILTDLLKLDPASALQTLIIEQIYDSALLAEGIHPDPSSMVPRVQQLMQAALAGSAGGSEKAAG
ncbi:MAG: molecular chaperone HtpG [Anaerolineales bacterium]